MEMDVRHLRTVDTIATEGSLSKAAATLGLSQPALTTQLQRIERHFGGQLFRRGRHGAVATPLGEFVLAKARLVLPAVDELNREAGRYAAGFSAAMPLRYGAVPGPLMAGLLQRLASRSVTAVSMRTEPSSLVLADLVAHRSLELAALLEYVDYPVGLAADIERRVIAVEPAFVLLPADCPLAERAELELSDLRDASWVLPPLADNGLRDTLDKACAPSGFRPRLAHEADASGARDLIASGHAIGIGQASFRATPGIAVRAIVGSPLRVRHSLIWATAGPIAAMADQVVSAATGAYDAAVRRSRPYRQWLSRHSRSELAS
ncbi:DNA-binding transcriptional regulator, LysR family [Amycolatopsis arida]|uniref:DNA-binding transcriptional regulator, LysR family n=1 Tax=Amycolatopsis arida TaxID=587909 RepID=A0A1I6ACC0_9PSEU|nr:LysR family transcriptional regulator [Amycolatopsis arida]TDX97627.1 DNA-binding transcriptional LysR family regulator [Amycolatopsis arida]SFQ66386.1 DNA-binding transcriptional regulator, LysR family [Amycolatopsis arida]